MKQQAKHKTGETLRRDTWGSKEKIEIPTLHLSLQGDKKNNNNNNNTNTTLANYSKFSRESSESDLDYCENEIIVDIQNNSVDNKELRRFKKEMYYAIARNNLKGIEQAINCIPPNTNILNTTDANGWNFAMLCAHRCQLQCIDLLIANGINIAQVDENGVNALHLLLQHTPLIESEKALFKRIIGNCVNAFKQDEERVAFVNKRTISEGNTPLHTLCSRKNPSSFLIHTMLTFGADPLLTNSNGESSWDVLRKTSPKILEAFDAVELLPQKQNWKLPAPELPSSTTLYSARGRRSSDPNLDSSVLMKITIVPKDQREFAALMDQFYASKQLLTRGEILMSTNSLFEVAAEADCLICPCFSSRGPTYPKYSVAQDILSLYGTAFEEFVNAIIVNNFFGELYFGASFLVRIIHTTKEDQVELIASEKEAEKATNEEGIKQKDSYILFVFAGDVTLVDNAPLSFVYQTVRHALVHLNKHNLATLNNEPTITYNFYASGTANSQVNEDVNAFNSQASSVPTASSSIVLADIVCPMIDVAEGFNHLQHPQISIAKQLVSAISNSPTTLPVGSWLHYGANKDKTWIVLNDTSDYDGIALVSASRIKQQHRAFKSCETAENRKLLIDSAIKRKALSTRGLYDIEELDYILQLIAGTDSAQREDALVALADIVRYNRVIAPTDIRRNKVVRKLTARNDIFTTFVDAVRKGDVICNTPLDASSFEKEGEAIGVGATARVYSGSLKSNGTTQQVAIKLFDCHIGEREIEEFRLEAAFLTLFNHPNLITCYGAGITDEQQRFIILEFASRGSLYNIIRRQYSDLNWNMKVRFCIQLCKVVNYLHSMSIIHRDLKSLNLLVTEDWQLKLTDFGTTRVTATHMTKAVGTACWMAPEVFSGKYSTKADVYSIGIVLYELFTGLEPYCEYNNFELPKLVIKGTRPTIPKMLSKKVARIIQRCWADKPTKRPSLTKVIEQIEALAPLF